MCTDKLLSFKLRLVLFCHLGHALSALGRKDDALFVWEQGYEHALHQSADLKQLLELEDLLTRAKQGNNIVNGAHGSPKPQTVLGSHSNGNLSETLKNQNKTGAQTELHDNASDKSQTFLKSTDKFDSRKELNDEDREYNKSDGHVNGSPDVLDKLSYNSESCNDSSDASESCDKVSTNSNDTIDITEILRKTSKKFEFPHERKDDARKNKKFCVARISKSKSISVDFRLSRGIAEVCVYDFTYT